LNRLPWFVAFRFQFGYLARALLRGGLLNAELG
jgi:hypothetical protein